MTEPDLVPELAVADLKRSMAFWCDMIGFSVRYERPEDRFAYLTLGRAHVMLDQISIGRTWVTDELTPPLGRGINFEVQVKDLDPILRRLDENRIPLFLAPEEQWYRSGELEVGVHQFLVQDPDGYLLRLQTEIGTRPVLASMTSKEECMAQRPEIVCICGSMRFATEIRRESARLTLAGAIVLAPGETSLAATEPITMEQKAKLEALHRHKIDLADRVVVVNPSGYVGESTRGEIEYARAAGKPISFTQPE